MYKVSILFILNQYSIEFSRSFMTKSQLQFYEVFSYNLREISLQVTRKLYRKIVRGGAEKFLTISTSPSHYTDIQSLKKLFSRYKSTRELSRSLSIAWKRWSRFIIQLVFQPPASKNPEYAHYITCYDQLMKIIALLSFFAQKIMPMCNGN